MGLELGELGKVAGISTGGQMCLVVEESISGVLPAVVNGSVAEGRKCCIKHL